MLRRRLLELLTDLLQAFVAIVELPRALVRLVGLAIDRLLLLCEAVLLSPDLLATDAEVFLRFLPQGARLVLGLDERLARDPLRLPLGLQDHLLRLGLGALGPGLSERLAHDEPDADPQREGHDPHDHRLPSLPPPSEKHDDRTKPCRGHRSAVRPKMELERRRGRRPQLPSDPICFLSVVTHGVRHGLTMIDPTVLPEEPTASPGDRQEMMSPVGPGWTFSLRPSTEGSPISPRNGRPTRAYPLRCRSPTSRAYAFSGGRPESRRARSSASSSARPCSSPPRDGERLFDGRPVHPFRRQRREHRPAAGPPRLHLVLGHRAREALVVDETHGLEPVELLPNLLGLEAGDAQAGRELVPRARAHRQKPQRPLVTIERVFRLARTPGLGQPFP